MRRRRALKRFLEFDGRKGRYGCLMMCLSWVFQVSPEDVPNVYRVWGTTSWPARPDPWSLSDITHALMWVPQ